MMETRQAFYGSQGDKIAGCARNTSAWIEAFPDQDDIKLFTHTSFFVTPDQARQIIDALEEYATPKPEPEPAAVAAQPQGADHG